MTMLVWYVLELTGSAFQVALVGFFGMAPMLFLGILGGTLADRFDRRRLLLGVQFANFAGAGVTTALLLAGMLEVWHAFVLVSISGVGWALDSPSRRSIILNLVGRAAVTNAVALDSMAMHSSRMAGPALAGLLISLVDVPRGFFVILAFYVFSLSLMWLVRLSPEQPGGGSQPRGAPSQSILRNLAEGLVYVRGNRTIIATIMVTIIMNLFVFSYMQMVPVIAVEVLMVGPGPMGLLMGVDGFGSLMGSVLIASAATIRHHGQGVPHRLDDSHSRAVAVFAVALLRAVVRDSAGAGTRRRGIRHDAVADRDAGVSGGDAGPGAGRYKPGHRDGSVGLADDGRGGGPGCRPPRR